MNINLNKLFTFWMTSDKKDLIENLMEKISLHKNWATATWQAKDSKTFSEIDSLGNELGLDFHATRKALSCLKDYMGSPSFQKYISLCENPNQESFLEFAKTLKESKIGLARARASFPEFIKQMSTFMDPRCLNDEERYMTVVNRGRLMLRDCPICGSPIHNLKMWETSTCSSKECLSKLSSENQAQFSPEKKNEIKEKMKSTCLERYGTPFVQSTPAVREKMRSTCLERYGVEFAAQVDHVKKKKEETFLEKYGNRVATRNEGVKEKIRKTCIEKYGAPNIKQSDACKEIFLKKYGVENSNLIGKDPEKISITKDKDLLKEYLENHKNYDLSQIADDLGFTTYWVAHQIHEFGLEEISGIKPGDSNKERALYEFICSIYPAEKVVRHERSLIYPLELDIYIPEKRVAFEFNGNFWHSDAREPQYEESRNAKTRHAYKTRKCLEKGVRLIHIFEYEWDSKKERLKSFIKDILQEPEIIYARKCVVREVPSSDTKQFLDENHLQGFIKARVNIGLFFEDQMVACMSFSKPRFSKEYDWELMRFAVKSGFKIPGAAGKLFSYFLRNYEGSIITYSDASKMTGNVYRALGFKEHEKSSPSYVWHKASEVLSRFETQKHKLLEQGFEGSSETEIMEKRGYHRIYDCGNYIFTYEGKPLK